MKDITIDFFLITTSLDADRVAKVCAEISKVCDHVSIPVVMVALLMNYARSIRLLESAMLKDDVCKTNKFLKSSIQILDEIKYNFPEFVNIIYQQYLNSEQDADNR